MTSCGAEGPCSAVGGAARAMAWVEDRARPLSLGVCAAVVLAGTVYAFALGASLPYHDEREYLALADSLQDKGIYSVNGRDPTAFRPPTWPFLLAGARFFGASVVGLRLLNLALFAACLLVLRRIVERSHSPTAGLAAVSLAALYPVLLYTAATLYPQMLEALLLLLLAVVAFDDRRPTGRVRVLAGVVSGLLVLTVPLLILLVPAFALLSPGHARWRDRATTTAVVGVVVLVMVAGWSLRHLRTFGDTAFVSTNGGVNLLLGNSENATPSAGVDTDISRYVERASTLDEFDRDRFYRDQAVEWVRRNTADAASLYARKVANYFDFRTDLSTESESSGALDAVLALTYGALALLALARFPLRRRLPFTATDRGCLVVYLLSALVTAIAFSRVRFRVPFDLLLVAFAAPALVRLATMVVHRRCPRGDPSCPATAKAGDRR